jgi:hypothetical protein
MEGNWGLPLWKRGIEGDFNSILWNLFIKLKLYETGDSSTPFRICRNGPGNSRYLCKMESCIPDLIAPKDV